MISDSDDATKELAAIVGGIYGIGGGAIIAGALCNPAQSGNG